MKQNIWWAVSAAIFMAGTGVSQQAQASGGGAQGNPPAAAAPPQGADTPKRAAPASGAPRDAVWGPGREVQAGLALTGRYGGVDQHTGLYVFGVYVRNRSKNTLTVTCPTFDGLTVPGDDTDYTTLIQSPFIFCSPHIQDGKGKPVDVTSRQKTDSKEFSVGPGQATMVSHWMLRTIDRRAKVDGNAKYTLVAFVDPGKYRINCDVTASWGSMAGRRNMLRTGEVAFKVYADDILRK